MARGVFIFLETVGVICAALTFAVHLGNRNPALVLTAGVCVAMGVLILVGQMVLPDMASPTRVVRLASPALNGFCEFQSFTINVLGVSVYASSLCLAIELNVRCGARNLISEDRSVYRRVFLYLVLTFGWPILLAGLLVGLRTIPFPLYYTSTFCDQNSSAYSGPIYTILFILTLILFTLVGSIFTVYAVIKYSGRRKEIMRMFQRPPLTAATRSVPMSPLTHAGPGTTSHQITTQMYGSGMEGGMGPGGGGGVMALSASGKQHFTTTGLSQDSMLFEMPPMVPLTRAERMVGRCVPMAVLARLSPHTHRRLLADRMTKRSILHHSSQMSRTHSDLLGILHRMVIWCIGYHIAACIYMVESTVSVVQDFLKDASGANTDMKVAPDYGMHPLDEDDPRTLMQWSLESNLKTRTISVILIISLLSMLLFLCFGTSRTALKKYKFWFWTSWVQRIRRQSV
ncbi:hypothetical protein CXG81DRAFT_16933 [Caulochytrium protostelioides]|uniref:Uncharacterized protein n=1 Tax=Caulochytrium protostelioides TaxID=1555241 RepID=A0A4P9XDJ7_9FUNG|nr:hypothetical protein CXG81DRAFT_16933 [Caulochytrium protostelioides]|eukprot:RKP03555.1 hypothetical protein CXG81DRAFT_16933 [Caulochytrium protostelioides]